MSTDFIPVSLCSGAGEYQTGMVLLRHRISKNQDLKGNPELAGANGTTCSLPTQDGQFRAFDPTFFERF
jgi:hypothetical protein